MSSFGPECPKCHNAVGKSRSNCWNCGSQMPPNGWEDFNKQALSPRKDFERLKRKDKVTKPRNEITVQQPLHLRGREIACPECESRSSVIKLDMPGEDWFYCSPSMKGCGHSWDANEKQEEKEPSNKSSSKRTASNMRKRSTVQHLEKGHHYKAHFDSTDGTQDPYDGVIQVKDVDHTPGAERATVNGGPQLGDFSIYGVMNPGDKNNPYTWGYGAKGDPVTFTHMMAPGLGGGPQFPTQQPQTPQVQQPGQQPQQPQQPMMPQQQQQVAARRRRIEGGDIGEEEKRHVIPLPVHVPETIPEDWPEPATVPEPDRREKVPAGARANRQKRGSEPFSLDSDSVVEPDKMTNELNPVDNAGLGSSEPGPDINDYSRGLTNVGSIRDAKKSLLDTSWFNGTSDAIFDRLDTLQRLTEELHREASKTSNDDRTMGQISDMIFEATSQMESLGKVANEYVEFDEEDYLSTIPGGLVASDYGLHMREHTASQSLGPDDGSLLFVVASQIEDELEQTDWNDFVRVGSELWVNDQGDQLLSSELGTREASILYAQRVTLPILDVKLRAGIIDGFVTSCERHRRSKQANNHKQAKFASIRDEKAELDSTRYVEEAFGDTLSW